MPNHDSRSVVLFTFVSLDGVAEEPGDWFTEDGPELFAYIATVIASQTDVLLGRGTYDYWADHWPTSDLEPFAPFINATPKHVATSSDLTPAWNASVRMTAPAEDHVRELKRGSGGDIGIHGSISLAQSLLGAGLVDELRIVVAPVLAGRGRRLFPDDVDLRRFELVELDRSAKGSVFAHYRRGQS